jgi:hypothetical protein
MALDMIPLSNTGVETGDTPFFHGGDAVFVNFTAGSLIVQGSDDNGVDDAWATYVTVPATGMIRGTDMPKWIRVSTAATVYALAAL